jgi:hypothetical protein
MPIIGIERFRFKEFITLPVNSNPVFQNQINRYTLRSDLLASAYLHILISNQHPEST